MKERQKIVNLDHVYDKEGEYLHTIKTLTIPKIINSDISFELMFGFSYPIERTAPEAGLKEVTINHTNIL